MKNIKYITLVVALFFAFPTNYSHANSLTAFITTAGDTPQSSITLKAGDPNGSTSNVIFYAHVNADAGSYRCYWDLGEGSGYDAGYSCSASSLQLQQRQNVITGVYNSSLVLSSIGNNYTRVGDYTVKFKVTDVAGVTVEAAPLLVHVTNDVRPAKITVISPSAGQSLRAGQSLLVQWNNDNVVTSKVNVSILDAENRRLGKALFGGSIVNDGSENWIVTPFTREDLFDYQTRQYVSGSGRYIIVVQCIGGSPCEQGESGQFTIAPADTATQADTSGWEKYSDTSVSFEYPALISAKQDGGTITLGHSVAYRHPNPCDFKGDAPPLDRLGDFGVSLKVVNQNLKDFVQSSTYPGWDYVSKNPFTFGSLNGFKVSSGFEGCGEDIYYLTISSTQTLVIHRGYVAEFNSINGDYQIYLNLPGIISPNKGQEYFNHILSTLKFITSNQSSITVLSPNGGENLRIGSAQIIKWSGGQNPFELMLETYSEGELVVSGWIDTKVNPITGQYTWKVGDIYNTDGSGNKVFSTILPGKYFIRISDFKTGSLDRSDNLFTISAKLPIPSPVNNQNLNQPKKSPIINNTVTPSQNNVTNDTQINSNVSVDTQETGVFSAIKNMWKKFLSIF